mmetsp:Transcript_118/g.321  ORF Transcript_118/g.321 Transcript_118/m.321 type:complete len:259 (-) Transcript_118:124-900(-)
MSTGVVRIPLRSEDDRNIHARSESRNPSSRNSRPLPFASIIQSSNRTTSSQIVSSVTSLSLFRNSTSRSSARRTSSMVTSFLDLFLAFEKRLRTTSWSGGVSPSGWTRLHAEPAWAACLALSWVLDASSLNTSRICPTSPHLTYVSRSHVLWVSTIVGRFTNLAGRSKSSILQRKSNEWKSSCLTEVSPSGVNSTPSVLSFATFDSSLWAAWGQSTKRRATKVWASLRAAMSFRAAASARGGVCAAASLSGARAPQAA